MIPLPTARFVRRRRLVRLAVALAVAALLALVMAARLFIARATSSRPHRVQEPGERRIGILPMAYHVLRAVPHGGAGVRAMPGV